MMNKLDELEKLARGYTPEWENLLKLIAVARVADKLVNKTSGWRKNFSGGLPEDWISWMEELEKAVSEVGDG